VKVFVVRYGSYLGNKIEGVFSTKKKAIAFKKKFMLDNIEEHEVDSGYSLLKRIRGKKVFNVRMSKSGEVLDVWRWGDDIAGGNDLAEVEDAVNGHYLFDIDGNLVVPVLAKDKEHAVKIASDLRARILAEGKWGKDNQGQEVF